MFRHNDNRHFTVGHGQVEFKINFSGRGKDSVYVYRDRDSRRLVLLLHRIMIHLLLSLS